MVGIGVAEVEVGRFYAVQMGNSYSDPRCQLLYLHTPYFQSFSIYVTTKLLLNAGYSRIIRWLPLIVILAFVGLRIVIQTPFN